MCFIQINLRHSRSATSQLTRRVEKLKTYILLITEPWVRNHRVQGLKSLGNVYYVRDKSFHPRACIVASRDLKLWTINGLCDEDNIVCKLCINDNDHYITSSYLDRFYDIENDSQFSKIIAFCESINKPLLIGTDSNAHSF